MKRSWLLLLAGVGASSGAGREKSEPAADSRHRARNRGKSLRDSGLLSVEELQDAPLVVEGYHDDATRHDGHGGIERKARRNGGPAAAEGGTGDINHATAVLILDGDGRIAWRVDGGSGGVAELLAGAR